MAGAEEEAGGAGPPAPAALGPSAAAETQSVRVAMRARPLLAQERAERRVRACVACDEGAGRVVLGRGRAFTFDRVFGAGSTQEALFEDCAVPLVEGCFEGYNATILAYGQTGSGKTYTMLNKLNTLDEEVGLIPRVLQLMFEGIDARRGQTKFKIKCQFLEIYNEEVKDLLHPETKPKNIAIREGPGGRIVVSGAKEQEVRTYEEVVRHLEMGELQRTTGSTLMNEHSSRSHAIFTISVEQCPLASLLARGAAGKVPYIAAKFHLVDLAGSERNKKTGARGARFKESVTINQGLLALGNVISALGDPRKRGGHVPYRESKLTRMLQDSLGGNSRTYMIACVSSSDSNIEETLNTLKYAYRAKSIKNRPKVNITTSVEPEEPEPELQNHTLSTELLEEMTLYKEAMENECGRLRRDIEDARARVAGLEDANKKLAAERDFYCQTAERRANQVGGILQVMGALRDGDELSAAAEARVLQAVADSGLGAARHRPATAAGRKTPDLRGPVAVGDTAPATFKLPAAAADAGNREREELRGELEAAQQLLRERENLLVETQEDLARDELIFAEKEKEVAKLQEALHAMRQEMERVRNLGAARSASPTAAKENRPAAQDAGLPLYGELLTQLDDDDGVVTEATFFEEDEEDEGPSASALEESLLEQERARLEDMHRKQVKDFTLSKQNMDRQLKDLSFNIAQKEELIIDLQKNEQHARMLSQQYEQRMRELEERVVIKEEEVSQLRHELTSIDESMAKTEEEKRRMRLNFEERLSKVSHQLRVLKKQQRDQEDNRVEKVRLKSQIKVKSLEGELGRMKTQQDTLRRKIRETHEAHERDNEKRMREVERLRKQMEVSHRRLKELENINMKQRVVLKRKSEEAAVAQRKLKELNAAAVAGDAPAKAKGGASARERGNAYSTLAQQRAGVSPAKRPGSGRAGASPERRGDHKAWLQRAIDKLLQKKEAEEHLEGLKAKKIGLLTDREALAQQKANLELKQAREQHGLQSRVAELTRAINDLDAEIVQHQGAADAGDRVALQEVEALRSLRTGSYSQRSELQTQLERGALLGEADARALEDVEDRVDALDTEIEYINEQMGESQRELIDIKGAYNALQGRVAGMSLTQAKDTLHLSLLKAVQIKNKERASEARLCDLEVRLAEKGKEVETVESNLRLKDFEYERRITELQKEHARKVQDLLSQISSVRAQTAASAEPGPGPPPAAAVGGLELAVPTAEAAAKVSAVVEGDVQRLIGMQQEQIQLLDKDNFYYKETNREIKRKLRELLANVDQDKVEMEAKLARAVASKGELERLNDNLMKELENYKGHLKDRGAAIRLSRADLRPLTAEQVQDRKLRVSRATTPLA